MKYIIAVFTLFLCAVSCTNNRTEKSIIIQKVKVDLTKTPQEAISATHYTQYVEPSVMSSMPQPEVDEVEVYFICFDQGLSSSQLEQMVHAHGLKLVDPITLCAFNEQYPELANTIPNATQWRDKNDKIHYMSFVEFHGEHKVNAHQDDFGWGAYWFFGCVRK